MAGKSDEPVALVVADGWSVFVDGQQRSAGDTVRVDPDTAEHWLRRGWVEPVKKTPVKAAPRRRSATATWTRRQPRPPGEVRRRAGTDGQRARLVCARGDLTSAAARCRPARE
jgi:hypothetical protein